MKASHTLLFMAAVILLLGIGWFFFPMEGFSIGSLDLRFPSYAEAKKGEAKEVDVDAVLDNVNKSFEMSQSQSMVDSIKFFCNYLTENPNRIYLPGDDYEYFDNLFALFDQARNQGKICRIMHYGDSQIEMDRISSVLRQCLQERFGGSGPNMIPAVQAVPTVSVSQHSSGITRYTLYGDSTTRRAPHNRYGVLSQFGQVNSEGSISFTRTNHSRALEKTKEISRVSILLGHNSEGFTASLKCDTIVGERKVMAANDSVSLITWELPANVKKGTISFKGHAEIYAVLLDGDDGLAIDNVPLRGCSGNIFTRLNKDVMRQSFETLDTRMIILQFGGNRMPGITSSNNIVGYIKELEKQINYMKEVAPQAVLLFIGPADMGRSYGGKLGTWKRLPELNDSLRAMALRNNIAYWDMFHVMGGEGSMVQWVKHQPPLAGPDYIHFTFYGAQSIGDNLAKSLMTYYDFYKLRQQVPQKLISEYIKKASDTLPPGPRYAFPVYDPFNKQKNR